MSTSFLLVAAVLIVLVSSISSIQVSADHSVAGAVILAQLSRRHGERVHHRTQIRHFVMAITSTSRFAVVARIVISGDTWITQGSRYQRQSGSE